MNDPEADPGILVDSSSKAHDANGNIMSGESAHPVPRLCHLRRWEGLSYGFNLISRKGRTGHFIDNIEYGLAAYYSGLKNGDRVVEINGLSVTEMPHGDVVKVIKESGKDGVRLLVVDQKTEDYFKEKGIMIKSSSSRYQVQFLASPVERPADVIEEDTSHDVRIRDKPRKKSSIFKRFSTPEPPPPLPMDAILPVETVYATLGSADDLNNSINRSGARPKLPQVNNTRDEGNISGARPKSPPGKTYSGTLEVPTKSSKGKAKIPNTTSLPGKLRRLSAGKTQPKARLCRLIKSPGQRESYGFVLRTYHDTMEKMIVRVDGDGIAIRTGIKEMDFLIEVNGVNVSRENHQQVTSRIRNSMDEISLLVVSPEDMTWFRRNSRVPKSSEAVMIETPGRAGRSEVTVRDSPRLRTSDQAVVKILNRVESDERSSTRMDEFQLSEYNSSVEEEERKQMEKKKRKEEAEKLKREQEESVRKAQEAENDRQEQERLAEQEWEKRRQQEEENERARIELDQKRREDEARAEAAAVEEQRLKVEETKKTMVNGKKESAEVPEPAPRKSSSASVLEPKSPAVAASAKSREEKQQEKEEVTEVGDGQEKELEENLSMTVAEIKKRLQSANKNKRRPFRENPI